MANSSTKAKSKSRKPMRDIKAAGSNSPRGSFTVRQLQQEDAPGVEPLMEEADTQEASFQVDKIDKDDFYQSQPGNNQDENYDEPTMEVTPVNEEGFEDEFADEGYDDGYDSSGGQDLEPRDTIRVKFGKFAQLVANHDFKDVVAANQNEDIIISSNLLTELAGARDSKGERRIPLVFLVGIAIGVVLTYILFST